LFSCLSLAKAHYLKNEFVPLFLISALSQI
jgi:hypothetical protein